jgi:CRP-like cAMP-binding protein
MEVENLLKGTSLFQNVGKSEIELIARSTRLENYKAGQVIVREGRVGAAFFIVVSGSVEVVRRLGSPNPVVLSVFGAGDFFGEISTFKHLPRSASVRALQETECLVIWRTDFEAFIRRFPEAAAEVDSAVRARLADGQDASQTA